MTLKYDQRGIVYKIDDFNVMCEQILRAEDARKDYHYKIIIDKWQESILVNISLLALCELSKSLDCTS